MSEEKEQLQKDMDDALKNGSGPAISRFALACIGGAIPFVGGVFGATAGAWSEAEQKRFNKIFASWLKLQEDEIKEIGTTLAEVMIRLDMNDPKVEERVQSPAYLSIIKKCFRDWSAAESEEKRILIRNLLANAASCSLASDDVIRLFIEWINKYSVAHFKVVGCVYNNSGISRGHIWQNIHGEPEREDSAEADLFKLIIFELSTGHLIRQNRQKDAYGRFIKNEPQKHARGSSSSYMTSAFDDEKRYELTELGQQFVHYAMNDIVPRIQGQT